MTALATPEQLEEFLQQSLGDWRGAAEQALDTVSSAARTYCRQELTRATSPVTMRGTSDSELRLPERPVVSITSITLGGVAIASTEWTLIGDTVIRPAGWGNNQTALVAVYVHGYADGEVPDDLLDVVLRAAGRRFTNPLGKFTEQMSGYGATIESQGNIQGPRIFTGDEREILNKYRLRAATV